MVGDQVEGGMSLHEEEYTRRLVAAKLLDADSVDRNPCNIYNFPAVLQNSLAKMPLEK
jgi:hypothetical protein